MAFKPGDKKPPGSGRKKGQADKRTMAVREKLELLGVDPISVLALFAARRWQELGYKSPSAIPPDLAAKCASDLVQYIAPRLKAIEHTGEGGGPIETVTTYETAWGTATDTETGDPETVQPDSGATKGSPK